MSDVVAARGGHGDPRDHVDAGAHRVGTDVIVPRSPMESTGSRTESVAADVAATRSALRDPAFVTSALADLLDQHRSDRDGPVWVLPAIHLGPRQFEVVLEPTWSEGPAGEVVIDALAVPPSSVDALLRLTCAVDDAAVGSRLTIGWRLRMWVPLPRPLAGAVRPALDASVERVVDRVFARIVTGVESGTG